MDQLSLQPDGDYMTTAQCKNSELRTQNYLFDNQNLTKPYKTVQLYYTKILCQETNTKEYRFRFHDGHLLELNILILMLDKTGL